MRTIITAEGLTTEERMSLLNELISGELEQVVRCNCGDPIPDLDAVGHYKPWGENPSVDTETVEAVAKGQRLPHPLVRVEL